MATSQQETEIKIAVPDVATARGLLRRAGFRVSRGRVFEANTIFDTNGRGLRASGCLLRVREAGKVATATYKGPATVGRHKSREELEFGITDPAMLCLMLERLGYERVFRYEKYRTEFTRLGSRGMATLDETPVGTYLELEGEPKWIDRMARALGFSEADYSTASYGRLYLEWCAREGVEPGDMVFAAPVKKARKAAKKAARKRG
jgi:adenylate cyclase class 2